MKKKFLMKLVLLCSSIIFLLATANVEKAFAQSGYQTKFIPIYNEQGEEVREELEFVITNAEGSTNVKSSDGEIKVRFKKEISHTIKLVENENYTMEDISVTVKEIDGFTDAYIDGTEDNLMALKVMAKGTSNNAQNDNNTAVQHSIEDLGIKLAGTGEVITEPLTFVFYNFDREENAGEYISENGKISGIKMNDMESYIVTLKDNPKYEMAERKMYAFMNGLPIDENDPHQRMLEFFEVGKKQPKPTYTRLYLKVQSNNIDVLDELEFEVVGGGETFNVKSNQGEVPLRIKIDTEYTAKLVTKDKYEMQDIVFSVVKDEDGFLNPTIKGTGELLVSFNITKKQTSQPKLTYTRLYLKVQSNKVDVLDELDFEIVGGGEIFNVKSNQGEVPLRIKIDTEYTAKLLTKDKYEMQDIVFSVVKDEDGFLNPTIKSTGELLVSFDLITKGGNGGDETPKNPDDCDICDQNKVKTNELAVEDENGKTITKDLEFELYNLSFQSKLGKVIAKNGKLPQLKLEAGDWYGLTLKDDSYKMNKKYMISFANGYPMDAKDPSRGAITKLVLSKKTGDISEDEERFNISIPVIFKGKSVNEEITFEFISDDETIIVKSKNGMIKTALREDINYMVRVADNDKYDIEMFPLTLKDKGQYGVNPYDHRDCNFVGKLELTEKGTKTEGKIIKSSEENPLVTVEGMDFRDLRLSVEKVNQEISALNGKSVEIYDIKFINDYRNEVSKLSNIDFTVTVRKSDQNAVDKVYFVADNGELEEKEIISQDGNYVIFKTTHFSKYAIVYSDKKVDDGPKLHVPSGNPKFVIKDEAKIITVTGGNFAGANLILNKLDKNSVEELRSYFAELYEIKFVNSDDETVKMPNAKYQVIVPKRENTDLQGIYFISENGDIRALSDVTYACETATFNTNEFGKFAVVYSQNNDDDDNSNNQTNPSNPSNGSGGGNNNSSNNNQTTPNNPGDKKPDNSQGNKQGDNTVKPGTAKKLPSLPKSETAPKKSECANPNADGTCTNDTVLNLGEKNTSNLDRENTKTIKKQGVLSFIPNKIVDKLINSDASATDKLNNEVNNKSENTKLTTQPKNTTNITSSGKVEEENTNSEVLENKNENNTTQESETNNTEITSENANREDKNVAKEHNASNQNYLVYGGFGVATLLAGAFVFRKRFGI